MELGFYSQADIRGDCNIGFYAMAADKYCIAGSAVHEKLEVLRVPVHKIQLMRLSLVKLFVAGNSSFVFIPDFLYERERENLSSFLADIGIEMHEIETERALGNMLLMNDNGIIISPLISRLKGEIERKSGLPCAVCTIAGISIAGSAGIATNKGCLLHPDVREKELRIIEKILGVKADIGTVSFGSPYPGAGVVANSFGFAASAASSGPELGRIAEALGFVDT